MRLINKTYRGFTLIEVLIVIVMMGIVMAIAVPSMRTWSVRHQKGAAAGEIFALLNQARSRAISQSQQATVTITSVAAPPGGTIAVRLPPAPAPALWTRTLNFGVGGYNAVGVLINPPPGGPVTLTISPRGTVTPSTVLTLRDSNFAANNETVTVTVGPLGDITIAP